MRNSFVVSRFVLFSVLFYINLLALGFAIWNMTVLNKLGISSLGAPTFVIFNGCLTLVYLLLCLAAVFIPQLAVVEQVRFESIWTGFLSALQLASSINVAVNGPPALCPVDITACASSSLVAALSWISSTILILYSFYLITSAITHASIVRDLWFSSVRAIPWFVVPDSPLSSSASINSGRTVFAPTPKYPHFGGKSVVDLEKGSEEVIDIKAARVPFPTPLFEAFSRPYVSSPPQHADDCYGDIWGEDAMTEKRSTWTNRVEHTLVQHKSIGSMRPSWAKRGAPGRRGVDTPFAVPVAKKQPKPKRQSSAPLPKSCWSPSTASARSVPPPLPPKARIAPMSPASTFYIDLEQDGLVLPVDADELEAGIGLGRPMSYGMFPEDVVDPDVPITRARRSEWVRADSSDGSVRSFH